MKRLAWRAGVLLCLTAAAGVGCGKGKESTAQGKVSNKPPVAVSLAPVERRDVDRAIEITGTVFGQDEMTISAKVGGRVAEITADLGDEVAPGEVLLRIDPADYELELGQRRAAMQASLAKLGLSELPQIGTATAVYPTVERARAEEANAKARLDRAQRLFEAQPPLISEQDFADIRTQWEVAARSAEVELLSAKATLAEARTQAAAAAIVERQISDATVRAPTEIAGTRFGVASRHVSGGEIVTAGMPLFRLVSSEKIKFRGAVPERFVGQVATGQAASLRVESDKRTFPGTVTRVSPQIDQATRAFEIEIEAANTDGLLKPGAFARASVVTRRETGVAFVPASAVVTFAGVSKVYQVEGGTAREVRVTPGARDGGQVEIVGDFKFHSVVLGVTGELYDGVGVSVNVP